MREMWVLSKKLHFSHTPIVKLIKHDSSHLHQITIKQLVRRRRTVLGTGFVLRIDQDILGRCPGPSISGIRISRGEPNYFVHRLVKGHVTTLYWPRE
jgi:hypothetical protein